MFAFACSLPTLVYADPTKLIISQNGTPIGQNIYDQTPDGAFTSTSSLNIGPIGITSTAKGHIKDGRLIDYVSDTNSPSGKVHIVLANGKLTLTSGETTKSVPYTDKTGLLGGNLHPQLIAFTLRQVAKTIAANPATKEVTLNVLFLDIGRVLPLKITALASKNVQVNGESKTARCFAVSLAGIDTEDSLDDQGTLVSEDVPVQKLQMVKEGWDSIFEDPLAKYPELSQPTFSVKTDAKVQAPMRDGVKLMCDVIRPDDNLKHPAILVRTPYGRAAEAINGKFYASRGYVYVVQDCRGREDSEGKWDPFVNEQNDGYDTIQWIASQPWCDGNVGMIGGSYVGYVQWAAAVEQPPALKCIVPQVSPPDAMRNIPYDHGVFALYLNLWWSKIVAGRHSDFSSMRSSLPHPRAIADLPLDKADSAVLGEHLNFYQAWLHRPTLNDWKGWDYTDHLAAVQIPVLHISGIWDGDEIGTHINWNTLRSLGRTNQWIVFGPWVHAFNTTHSLGDQEYGPQAILELDSLFLRWFDTWLKGKDVGLAKVPHVQLFVTGANKWVDLSDWPSPSSKLTTLFLKKNALAAHKGAAASESFLYDPSKDTKIPKAMINMDEASASTKVDLKEFRNGKGILFETAPFKKRTAITTPLILNLYFKSSAVNTDFFYSVVDIAPNGEAHAFDMGGRYRAVYSPDMRTIKPLKPGKAYELKIDCWDFAHEFAPGHRLGIALTSSGFPVYSRNTGTMDPISTATKLVPQRNKVLFGGSHASSVSFYTLWEK